MTAIERVRSGGDVYAIIVRQDLPPVGYNFVSADEDGLQVGINHYEKGKMAKPHFHPPLKRDLMATVEFLHIDSGVCELVLFDESKCPFYETILKTGDNVVLLRGGHSLRMLEDVKIVEVKQGPYFGPEKDKIFFEPKSAP